LRAHPHLISFDIFDNHVAWENISDLLKKYDIWALPTNVFSKKEILDANWCRARLINHVGYPQPEDEWLSTHFTYANFDIESQIFSHQIDDFRIKQEPQLKDKHFMDLTWPHEIFAKKAIFQHFQQAEIIGYEVRDVVIHNTNEPSKEVSQLIIPKITNAHAFLKDHPLSSSKVKKYMPHTKGMLKFSGELQNEPGDFVLSQEWFGDRNAFREILISQKVTKLILANHWKGLALEPVSILS
jgi:hypothetical protein